MSPVGPAGSISLASLPRGSLAWRPHALLPTSRPQPRFHLPLSPRPKVHSHVLLPFAGCRVTSSIPLVPTPADNDLCTEPGVIEPNPWPSHLKTEAAEPSKETLRP